MSPPRSVLSDATVRLTAAGVPAPRVDAELLLAHVLGVPRARLLMGRVDGESAARFNQLLRRRAAREPLQHIIGTAAFRYVDVAVGPGVFVPRPETELLIDAVLPALRGRPGPLVVDLCSGSGALAVSVVHEVPGTRVIAVEADGAALVWLRRNADPTAVEVVAGDVSDPELLSDLRGQVDVVVSNPPYVPAGVSVDPEVSADPPVAVFAGADGLALIPAVLARAAELLRPGGLLAMEHDDSHGVSVPALLTADGRWSEVADHADLAGRPRFVTAVRSSPEWSV
jgi:release factor glutamine methyltransferase